MPVHQKPTTYGPSGIGAPSFAGDAQYDVVVIGGGLSGLTTALELAQKNVRTLVLEARKIGDGPSGRSGGQVIPGFEPGIEDVIALLGLDATRALWDDIESTRARLHARMDSAADACDSMPGVIVAAMNRDHLDYAHEQAALLRRDFGFMAVETLSRADILQHVNSPDYIGGMIYTDARHINPQKYVQHLAVLAVRAGVVIAENSPVTHFEKWPNGFALQTPGGKIATQHVVFACGAMFARPRGLNYKTMGQRFVPSQTMIVATEVLPEDVLRRAMPGAATVFDGRSFLNYFRRTRDNRILFGGVDAITDLAAHWAPAQLARTMYKTLPTLRDDNVKIETHWAGLVDASKTLLPSIRRLSPGLYEVCGFSGQGHVLTAVAGEAIAEDIIGQGKKLARWSSLAPMDFNRNPVIAKLQLAIDWLPTMIAESLMQRGK